MMRGLSLFTGYGGLDLALSEYVKPIAYVEIEPYVQKVIAYRMADGSLPRAAILADVKNVRGSVGICDIIYGGFPCQDLSVAGNRAGLDGERSGLFWEIVRLTKEIKPKFVFIENVEGIRTKGLREVARAFTDLGYDFRWTRVSAKSVGANHRRNRFFGLAYSGGDRLGIENQQRRSSGENRERQANTGSNGEVQSLAYSASQGLERAAKYKEHLLLAAESGETISEDRVSEKQQNSCDNSWWSVEPDVGRVADGVAFRVDRIKALGNGVVPAQARAAFRKLLNLTHALREGE